MILNPYLFSSLPNAPSVSGITTAFNSSVASHTITLPATINAGDLILVMTLRSTTSAITGPAGLSYSSLTSLSAAGSASAYQLFYKTALGTEGGTTITFTTGAGVTTVLICWIVQAGTWQGSPQQAGYNGDTGMTADPPSLTPAWGAANNLWIAAYGGRQNASVSSWPLPDNQTTITTGSAGTGGRSMSACSTVSSVASLDPTAFSLVGAENGNKIAITTAIRPA